MKTFPKHVIPDVIFAVCLPRQELRRETAAWSEGQLVRQREGKRNRGWHCGRRQRKTPLHTKTVQTHHLQAPALLCCSLWKKSITNTWTFCNHAVNETSTGFGVVCKCIISVKEKGKTAIVACQLPSCMMVVGHVTPAKMKYRVNPQAEALGSTFDAITFNLYLFVFILKMNCCYITGEEKEAC